MVTFNFYTVAERHPNHNESVIYLRPTSSFGFEGFKPCETVAEYCWFGVDSDGTHNGIQISYDVDDPGVPEGCKLEVMFDGWIAEDNWLWIPIEEYWSTLDGV